jgi:HSP20 family protein
MDLLPAVRFGDLSTLRREMDQLWSNFFKEPGLPRMFQSEGLPVTDIIEEDDKIVIKADMPGMEKKDISITLADDLLTIKGERATEKEEKGKNFHRQERYFGKFQRMIRLPAEVDSNKIEAALDKGVLQITLKKNPAKKKKEIAIK